LPVAKNQVANAKIIAEHSPTVMGAPTSEAVMRMSGV
jgi:hypothetical protein